MAERNVTLAEALEIIQEEKRIRYAFLTLNSLSIKEIPLEIGDDIWHNKTGINI